MTKRLQYECEHCQKIISKWVGQCQQCKGWNTYTEVDKVRNKKNLKDNYLQRSLNLKNIKVYGCEKSQKISTGITEFDRVIGKGIMKGSLTLIGGEPGVGKSTLILKVLASLSRNKGVNSLYISGEESEEQVTQRAERLKIKDEEIYLLHETRLEYILNELEKLKPSFFVLDSIQTCMKEELSSSAGSVAQVKEVTYELMKYCKKNSISAFVIGHITKDGNISGPKFLEHMVDTVLYFESIRESQNRVLRSKKNRYSSTQEIGFFEMQEDGLTSKRSFASNQMSKDFLRKRNPKVYGRVSTCIIEGSRVIFLEVQSLVSRNKTGGNYKRISQGVETSRLNMLIAIIEKYFEIPISLCDIYINILGGLKVASRDIDLAIITSILSSYYKVCIDVTDVYFGEVGLTGEVSEVTMLEERLKEMNIYGLKKVKIKFLKDIEIILKPYFIKDGSGVPLKQPITYG